MTTRDKFVGGVKVYIGGSELRHQGENVDNPDQYQLELDEENYGLQLELFMHHCKSGEV